MRKVRMCQPSLIPGVSHLEAVFKKDIHFQIYLLNEYCEYGDANVVVDGMTPLHIAATEGNKSTG